MLHVTMQNRLYLHLAVSPVSLHLQVRLAASRYTFPVGLRSVLPSKCIGKGSTELERFNDDRFVYRQG